MQGIGASLSGLAAGVIVDHFGYSAAFLTLGAAAGVALIVFALGMPETAEPDTVALRLESVVGPSRHSGALLHHGSNRG
jgi:MFS family permease